MIVRSCASDPIVRLSVPFLRYGPYLPLWAVTSSPSISPTVRGRLRSSSASSKVIVSGSMPSNSDARLGFSFDLVPGSSIPTCTKGPNRPVRTMIVSPVSGSIPSSRGPMVPLARISRARSTVRSSGSTPSGIEHFSSSPRCSDAPFFQTRIVIGMPSESSPMYMELTTSILMVSRFSCETSCLSPGVSRPK